MHAHFTNRINLFWFQIFQLTALRGRYSNLWYLQRSWGTGCGVGSRSTPRYSIILYYFPSLRTVKKWQLKFIKIWINPRNSHEYSETDLWNQACHVKCILGFCDSVEWKYHLLLLMCTAGSCCEAKHTACVYLLAPCRGAHVASFHSLKGAVSSSSLRRTEFSIHAVYTGQNVNTK